MNNSKQKQIILIFGQPNAGKSTLSSKLETNFFPIHLDKLYVDFIRAKYQHLDSENLEKVIMGHYDMRFGTEPKQVTAWYKHILGAAKVSLKENGKISIEGYLLHPKASPQILTIIQSTLKKVAKVKTILVVNRTYFLLTEIDLKRLASPDH